MTAQFSRFSSLGPDHFKAVCFGQRIAALRDDIEESQDLVQWQFLTAIVIMIAVVYFLIRGLDSLWAFVFILPIIAVGSASLQHSLMLYRLYVHAQVMPALCEAFGRLRYTVGVAPDLCFERLVDVGLLARHHHRRVDDVFFGEYRGHQLTLALVNLWSSASANDNAGDDTFCDKVVVIAIRWPNEPSRLPSDELTRLLGGESHLKMMWSDGYLMVVLACPETPFNMGGLFEPSESFVQRLVAVARIIQMPSNVIDHFLDQDC